MRQKHLSKLRYLGLAGVFLFAIGQTSLATASNFKRNDTNSSVQSSRITVKGRVLDENGEGVPMASILVKGESRGAHTNMDGEFSLQAKVGDVLVISFIGYVEQEVTIKNASPLTITLKEDAETLETLVVETGYQKIDRRLFTGSADRISGENALIDGAADISKMLQGKAAGVQIQNVSGAFGAAPKIRVRGASSIHGDTKPLWVVDGVVLEDVVDVSADDLSSGNATTLISSAVAGLNANDIASFEILKDASATALYGARAMNGVIVVKTKKGRSGAAQVSYSGEFTIREKPSYSDYNILNSAEQMGVYREMYNKGFLNYASTFRSQNAGEFYVMAQLINQYDPETGLFGLANTPEAKNDFLNAAARRNTNWFGLLFKNSLQQNHSVSISGGTDKASFYGSISLFDDPGWSIADNVRRYTGNVNLGYRFSEKFRINFATNSSVRQQRAPGTTQRKFDNLFGTYERDFDINPFSYSMNTSRTMRATDADGQPFYYRRNFAPFSILNEVKENWIEIDMIDAKFQGELYWTPIKQVEVSALGSARFVKTTQETKATERSNRAMAYRATDDSYVVDNNRFLYKDPDNVNAYPQVVLPYGGFYETQDDHLKSYYFRASANYNDTYNDDHIVNALLGSEVKYADRTRRSADGYGMQFYKGTAPFTDYRIMKQAIENGTDYFGLYNTYDRFVAFFATASYSYQGKYTLNVTGRMDGSNLLGKARSARWLPTWNVSGSWNVRETFFPYNRDISRLLLRATYGLTASMGPARNSLPVFYNSRTFRGIASRDESYTYIRSLENKDLTWEKQYELNVGFDLGLFNNRISLSADGYLRNGFDLIGLVTTSGIGGEETKWGNFATMKSRGVEFTLNTRNIETRDFSWNTNFTFSWNENKITSLETRSRLAQLTREGGAPIENYPVRALFSIPFRGLNEEGILTFWLGEYDEDGKEIVGYKNINFQQNQNLEFLKYEGPVDPTIVGGFENSFTYKDFTLSIYATYQAGNVIRLPSDFSYAYSDQSTMPREMLNRWAVAGDEKVTNVPVILSSSRIYGNSSDLPYAYNAYNMSDVRVAKGDFFRLKDITLSYNVPREFLEEYLSPLRTASLRFVASNVWLIYSDKKLNGVDPEFTMTGGVAMPTPHQYTLTLRLGF